MKLIFISGPSGSGKTTLANQILFKINNGIILSTDNYYKTGAISKILSKFIKGYFDRRLSFNFKLFKKDIESIINNGFSNYTRIYDFKKKYLKKKLIKTKNINYIVIEGIFTKELTRYFFKYECFFLELKTNKNYCKSRVIKRDILERGKAKKIAAEDFLKSWDIYYAKSRNNFLAKNITKFTISKNADINQILKKIFNLKS